MSARAALRIVDPLDEPAEIAVDRDELARYERLAENVARLVPDLEAGLAAMAQRLWGDSRAGAINELNRLGARVQRVREDLVALEGDQPPTSRPRRLA